MPGARSAQSADGLSQRRQRVQIAAMAENNVVHHSIGRLVAGRIASMKTRADAIPYANAFRVAVKGLGAKAVIFADYRRVSVFSPEVADELQMLMKDMNPYVDRSAVLVAAEHATHSLQVERVVREAQLASRRRFTDLADAVNWLGEILTEPERRDLEQFIKG